jgi:glycosyltransferase XagB
MARRGTTLSQVLEGARVPSAPAPVRTTGPPPPQPIGFLPCREAAFGPTRAQWLLLGGILAAVLGAFVWNAAAAFSVLHLAIAGAFASISVLRTMGAIMLGDDATPAPPPADRLPSYTILAPLFEEPAMVAPLIRHLEAIDYPRDRLQVLLLLEEDDPNTHAAVWREKLPPYVTAVICPYETPRTKPHACNHGLQLATGELLVIYDAEDQPDPGQLYEAAARFAAGPPELACLQAPLRIRSPRTMVARQFALEYAALFEVVLPAMTRLGLPFPLGGTSNHFRTSTLRSVGGWDPYNVTEDADVGFRLARQGYRLGMMRSPTWEIAPDQMFEWLPQRTRWIKGYMQTWGVHMRRPSRLDWRAMTALQYGVGVAIGAAFLHGPAVAWIAAQLLIWVSGGGEPNVYWLDLWLLAFGWGASLVLMSMGAQRAGRPVRLFDMLMAPLYWSLQSLAACHAFWQLLRRPFHWDKTPHRPLAAA